MPDPGPHILTIALGLWTVVLAVPLLVFTLECQLAVWPRRRPLVLARSPGHAVPPTIVAHTASPDSVATVVLIPAHNEEAGLDRMLRAILPTLGPRDEILVVADNCTDRTADVARECGVRAVERFDSTKRGKGFALAFGVRSLRDRPPEALVILDADCRVNDQTIQLLAAEALRSGRPAQALFLSDDPARGATLGAVSRLGFRFKNLVRPAGLARAGGPCHLLGSGMSFPWKLVEQIDWDTPSLAEDMELGIDLALRGYPARFCPEVGVWTELPAGTRASVQQRTRWEQGHLRTLVSRLPRLVISALRQRRLDLLLLALDMCIPPFSLLVLAWCGGLVATTAAWWWLGASPLFAQIFAGLGVAMVLSVLAGWWVYCRDQISLVALLAAPLYMLRKLPIYVKFFLARGERRWIRGERPQPVASSR
jgi:cellulose synthase/poly-beta-1,6-N-acetylglucosamine synthase-like glycosyltransferase